MSLTRKPPVDTEPLNAPSPRPRPKSGGSRSWVNVVLGLALVVAIGGVAFAVGRVTAPAPTTAFPGGGPGGGFNGPGGGFNGRPGASGQPGGFLGGGGITLEGTVESIDGTTLVLRTSDGQTVEVALGSDTAYHEQAPATTGDVQAGSNVQIRMDIQAGAGAGTGGNLSASDITIVP